MPLVPHQILENRYQVLSLLAEGGYGAVYMGIDLFPAHRQRVAIKEYLDMPPEVQRQICQEAQILAKLGHPNLPHVTDYFSSPGTAYYYVVMDFVEGENLQAMLDRTGQALPVSKVLSWIDQVCSALEYLHAQQPPIIHRDIKPANIIITPRGRAMLVDFGIPSIYNSRLRTTLGARTVTPP